MQGLTIAAAGIGFQACKKNQYQEGSPKLFNTNVTNCEAPVEQEFPSITDLPKATTISPAPIPDWKKQLKSPDLESLPWLERVEIITREEDKEHVTEVFLLGVSHNSNKSAENVKVLLETVDPEVAFIELCCERAVVLHLTADQAKQIPFKLFPTIKYAYDQGLGAKHMLCLIAITYAQVWVARHGSGAGGEFRIAYDFVKSTPPDQRRILVLGDRPYSVTLGRMIDLDNHLSGSTTTLDLEELYDNTLPCTIELKELEAWGNAQLKKAWKEQDSWAGFIMHGIVDNHDLLASCGLTDDCCDMQFPAGTEMRVLVQERDIYMVCKLLQIRQTEKFRRVVVIVGGAHLRGMAHLLNAKKIGATREPEEVLSKLIASEKYPEGDPYLQDLVKTFVFYDNEACASKVDRVR